MLHTLPNPNLRFSFGASHHPEPVRQQSAELVGLEGWFSGASPTVSAALRADRMGLVCFVLVLCRNLSLEAVLAPSSLISAPDLVNQ